jgi:hypothetical protein
MVVSEESNWIEETTSWIDAPASPFTGNEIFFKCQWIKRLVSMERMTTLFDYNI